MTRAPGWIPDPNDPTTQWYWDGSAWTGRAPITPQAKPPSKVRTELVNIAAGIVLFLVVMAVLSFAAGK